MGARRGAGDGHPPGPVKESVAAFQAGFVDLLRGFAATAIQQQELPAGEDPDRLALELNGITGRAPPAGPRQRQRRRQTVKSRPGRRAHERATARRRPGTRATKSPDQCGLANRHRNELPGTADIACRATLEL